MPIESMRIYFQLFLRTMKREFGPLCLNREPNAIELTRITERYAEFGLRGCQGSVDCMHLHWKQFTSTLKGQYHSNRVGKLASVSCKGVRDRGYFAGPGT